MNERIPVDYILRGESLEEVSHKVRLGAAGGQCWETAPGPVAHALV